MRQQASKPRRAKNDAQLAEAGHGFRLVMQTVREYVFTTHRFPQVADLSKLTKIHPKKCHAICDTLVGQRQLYVAFGGEGRGSPKVVVPCDMMQSMLRTQARPEWISKYELPERAEFVRKLEDLQTQLSEVEQMERLLYLTDIPLEEAVASTLQWLGFSDVRHHQDVTDNPDITFTHNGVCAIVEVQGPSGPGDKEKVLQLQGWLNRAIGEGKRASEIRGFYVLNHYREVDPEARRPPLTAHAKEQLRLFHGKLLTTVSLFDIACQVKRGKLAKEKARDRVWKGDAA